MITFDLQVYRGGVTVFPYLYEHHVGAKVLGVHLIMPKRMSIGPYANFYNINPRIKLFNSFFMHGKFVIHWKH